jgi:hypothetical protein
MDKIDTRMRLALAAAAVVLAAVVISVVLVGRSSGTATYTPVNVGASGADSRGTPAEVREHAEAVVLATVLAEGDRESLENHEEEGGRSISRRITIRIDRTLWQKEGAAIPPETFDSPGGVWHESKEGKRTPAWLIGDVGQQYVFVVGENIWDLDGDSYRWMYEGSLLAPIMNGRTPAEIDSEKPYFKEIEGKTPDELEQLFAAKLGR